MSDNYITVSTKAALEALVNHQDGEIALCEEDQTYYYYNNGWNQMPAEMTSEGLQIDLYTLNKQIVAQLPPFDIQRLQDARDTLENWKKENIPYLLYGKEISYFTLFYPKEDMEDTFVDCVFDCLATISNTIYSFDVVSDNAIEIWMDYEGEATALYLFNYEQGMVYYYG